MSVSLIVEVLLSCLLAATLAYCAVLERRLSSLRNGQDGIKQTISDFSAAVTGAEESIRTLKADAESICKKLDERLSGGRALADELSIMTASGERIACRIELATPSYGAHLTAAMANRLQNLRPQARNS